MGSYNRLFQTIEAQGTMDIRIATPEDLPPIERVYATAREFMRANGNATQWNNGYPQRPLLENDIARECLYVITHDGTIHGVFYFAIEDDSTYHVIEEGQWLNDEPYGVIHRIASDGQIKGVFGEALAFAEQQTRDIRIDTHEHNTVMQHVLEKSGFERCGIIYCHDGSPRIAYHRVVE